VGHAMCIENKINTIDTLVGIGPRRRRGNIIKMHIKGMNGRV